MNPYKANIWKMYVLKFLISFHFTSGVLVPFFLTWGGITYTQMMILQSFFVFSVFMLEVPTGAVADRFSRKTSLIIGALLTGLAALIYASYPDFKIFLLGEFIWAIALALLSGADEALMYDSLKKFKQEKTSKQVFARFISFEMTGLMIAAPIGSIIAATLGLRYTMMFIIFPCLLGFLLAFTLKEPRTKKKIEQTRYLDTLISGITYFKEHKILKILAFDSIAIFVPAFMLIWTYQPLMEQQNIPLMYFGFVASGLTISQILVMNYFQRFEQFIGSKKRYLLWSALVTGIAFILMGINPFVPITIILILLVSGFGLSRRTLLKNYMNKHIESHNRATVLSSVSMLEKFVNALVYPLVGILVEWSLNYALITLGIFIVICAIVARTKEEHLID